MNRALTAAPVPVWRIGQLAITAALIALLWTAADGPAIAKTLAAADPVWLAAAVVTLLCQTVLSALRWRVTAAELGQTLPLRRAIAEYFMSQTVNQALPGGIMGDAARAVRARSDVGLAVSGLAVGLERLAGQIAMFVALAVAFIVTYLRAGGFDWPPHYAAPIGTALTLITLSVLGAVALWGRIGLLQGAPARWLGLARRALFSPRILPVQIGLGAAITLCNIAAFGFCVWAVDVSLPAGALFALVPLILFSMLIPLTVSGWGVREGSAALLLPLAGVGVAEAVAASVLFGVAILLAALPGLIALVSR